MVTPVVRIEEVSKRYAKDADAAAALDHLTLTVDPGEFIGIMGQSGSGKTTLLNLVGGLDRTYQGVVEVLGKDLGRLGDQELSRLRNESIGFVFQGYHLLPQLSCYENVALPAAFGRNPVDGIEKRVGDVLDKVGLGDRKSDSPSNLSGGQKQRVAIARAMVLKPALMLCDEPTGNLDQDTGRELISSLRDLSKSEGITVLLVTHESYIADFCDRIISLRNGRIEPKEEGE